MPKRVLGVASVRVDPLTFAANLRSLRLQELPKGVELDLHYVIDDPEPAALIQLIEAHGGSWEMAPERPADALYAVGPQTHAWNIQAFERLARIKQWLLDLAKSAHYDYVWVVDTDLVLDRRTLASALALDEDIVSSVFWTPWQAGSPAMPQVWLTQPYGQAGKGMSQEEFWDKLSRRKVVPVAGGGACMLVKTAALDKARYAPRLEGLPQDNMWQGEDRTFCILAERGHLSHVADGWPDIVHLYHPSDRQPESVSAVEAIVTAEPQTHAKYGDLVAFTLESLDDPQLVGRTMPVRGRLGGLWLAPELESALLDTAVGQERFIEILFPVTWPLEQLRGQRRIVKLHFVDAKPWGFPPGLAEDFFRGVAEP